MLQITEEKLLLEKDIREGLITHVEVLDSVKHMQLLPDIDMATTQQVADFYGVGVEAIKAVVFDHKDELLADGYATKTGREVKSLYAFFKKGNKIVSKRGHFLVETENGFVRMTNRSNGLFPKRAILRVGMLLRDSVVAKEVRNQLLNIEENAHYSIKTAEMDNELSLIEIEIGKAIISGDANLILTAMLKLDKYRKQEIERLEDELIAMGESLVWFTHYSE